MTITAAVDETTASAPLTEQCIGATHTCQASCLTWDEVKAMADSYCGVTTLLVVAGHGLYKLIERDGSPELRLAYWTLQNYVISIVDARASDEAEEDATA